VRLEVQMNRGLTRRMMVASGLLALLVGAAFAVLLRAMDSQREAGQRALASQDALVAAATVERLVLDLETGQRGLIITGKERFLAPWKKARRRLPGATQALMQQAKSVPAQERRAQAVVRSVDSYVRDYSLPVVATARRDPGSVRTEPVLAEGKRRVDALRGQLDPFVRAQRAMFEAREDRASADARRAVVVAIAGLAGSVLVIALFAGYMTRAIVVPVRRAATMATRLAAGHLTVRMSERSPGEIGALERAFNTMGSSLEESRDELRVLAEEQAALRRVATLVARAVPPPELFEAVAIEVRHLLGADATRLLRCPLDPSVNGAAALVIGSGRPARARCDVGAPIVVEGRLWGVMLATFERAEALAAGTEERMAQFTDLVATAIANANSRAELAASRARVVATADEARRRIERDLHDGAQQSLTHTVIALKLARRSIADTRAAEFVDEALGHAERATADLRELAHGILPAVLTRGGLAAGLESLVGRLKLPVSVAVTDERFPETVEATAYFIVAEALTNVVKHADARSAEIRAFVDSDALHLEVSDDGVGGAHLDGGSGLLGLSDRAAALNGTFGLQSRPGAGTVVTALLPIRD
jgi:signal transduction histidine kinase